MSPSMTPEVILHLMEDLLLHNVNLYSNVVSNWLNCALKNSAKIPK